MTDFSEYKLTGSNDNIENQFESFKCQSFIFRQQLNVGDTRVDLFTEYVALLTDKRLQVGFHLGSTHTVSMLAVSDDV